MLVYLEKEKYLNTAGKRIQWYKHYRNQYG